MKIADDRSEALRMELYTADEIAASFLNRNFTDNEKLQLQSGHTLHWKNMDVGGSEKRDMNVKMETFINAKGEIEKGVAVQMKAPKLEIPDKILDKKLNMEEQESLTKGNFFSLQRDTGVFMVKIDPKINGVIIRTPAELGIKEELGGYQFDKSELQRLANGQQITPKVFTSDKYGDFVASLQIKQEGLTNEYRYTNIVNISKKEAERLKPILNNNKGEFLEKDIDKVMDIMGADKSQTFKLTKSIQNGQSPLQSKAVNTVTEPEAVLGEIKKGFGNVIAIESYEGDYNGVFQKLDVAVTNQGNVFQTEGLSYLPSENGKMLPQLDLNRWKNISTEQLSGIKDEMKLTKLEKYGKLKTIPPFSPIKGKAI